MGAIVIEPGRPPDADALARLFAASRAHAMPWLPVLHDAAQDEAFFGGLLAGEEVLVARRDGAVLGFLVLAGDEVDHLYVRPDAQRAGLGSALLNVAKARRHGGLELWAFQRNEGALAFYARHGFVEVRRTDGRGNEEREPDVRLAWRAQAPLGAAR
jgi:GNAT superfamily N-acetyltransferase